MKAVPSRPPVRGRFAPTPSGPLHFGSLVAALASALEARSRGGEWLLRIDDADRAREAPGARDAILFELDALGFEWDGAVHAQHERGRRYRAAVDTLLASGAAFPCACSRRDIAAAAKDGETRYPGTCRDGLPPGRQVRSIRMKAGTQVIEFKDQWRGMQRQNLAREVGDFVIWRADGIASYHLATMLDDADAGITQIVRGTDLLASTPRQIHLQRLLGLPTPRYAHLPLVRENGLKLGKQTGAPRLELQRPARTLVRALTFLRQAPPAALNDATVREVWQWASAHWKSSRLETGA